MRGGCWTAALLLVVGCSPARTPGKPAGSTPGTAPTPAPIAPTAGTLGAKQVAARYFDRLNARDYRAAFRMWGGDGADTRGTLAAFTAANAGYARYKGIAGEPSVAKLTDGMEYVTVESSVEALARGQTIPTRRTGVLMLRRPVRRAGAPDDGGGWTIWGADIRERHCRGGQQAKAFGCVPA